MVTSNVETEIMIGKVLNCGVHVVEIRCRGVMKRARNGVVLACTCLKVEIGQHLPTINRCYTRKHLLSSRTSSEDASWLV
jgi:hypothetical protein